MDLSAAICSGLLVGFGTIVHGAANGVSGIVSNAGFQAARPFIGNEKAANVKKNYNEKKLKYEDLRKVTQRKRKRSNITVDSEKKKVTRKTRFSIEEVK